LNHLYDGVGQRQCKEDNHFPYIVLDERGYIALLLVLFANEYPGVRVLLFALSHLFCWSCDRDASQPGGQVPPAQHMRTVR
jgi:hypothetical protein